MSWRYYQMKNVMRYCLSRSSNMFLLSFETYYLLRYYSHHINDCWHHSHHCNHGVNMICRPFMCLMRSVWRFNYLWYRTVSSFTSNSASGLTLGKHLQHEQQHLQRECHCVNVCWTLKQSSIERNRVWGISLRSHRRESWQKYTVYYHEFESSSSPPAQIHSLSVDQMFCNTYLIKDLQRNAKFRTMRLMSPRAKMIIGPISRALWKYDRFFETFDPEIEWPNFKYWSVQDLIFIRTRYGRNVGRCNQEGSLRAHLTWSCSQDLSNSKAIFERIQGERRRYPSLPQ